MRNLLLKLFNSCLQQGIYPWNTSSITPIPKGGDAYNPDNYRAIALSSCIGKLFSSILLNRLIEFRQSSAPEHPNQLGFQKKAQTSDHRLTLKTLIEKYAHKHRKKLYTCFVDFRKAFDSVAREALLFKIAELGIGGNFFMTLHNMYTNTSTRIKLIKRLSNHIKLLNGVEQGHPLSPELFKIFIHDLSSQLNEVLTDIPHLNDNLISHLLWADDLVLLALDERTLQTLLNILQNYCTKWGLTVNMKKTKIMIFNKGGKHLRPSMNLHLGEETLETCDTYCYLGIVFVPSGKFKLQAENLGKRHYELFLN